MNKFIYSLVIAFTFFTFSGSATLHAEMENKVLRVINWTEYIAPDVIPNFEKICNCKVEYIEYEVEESMLSKIFLTPKYYDVAIISTLKDLINSKRIQKLDLSIIPNYSNIDKRFRSKEETYAIPYLFGTVGLVYRKDLFPERQVSWKDIFESVESVRGKIILLNDRREVYGGALKYLGYSMNSSSEIEAGEAAKIIMKAKPHIYKITSDLEVIRNSLKQGRALVSMAYSGDALSWMDKFDNLEFQVPKEGGSYFVDKIVIFNDSPNMEIAYKFVNYILEARVSASLSNELNYGTLNLAAKEYINRDVLNNKAIFPSDEVMGKMELIKDVKIERFYNRAWRKIMK